MPTPYMLEHRRRPYAYDTYTGGVPCLSSSFSEIGDFDSKDESGNALLAPWLSLRFARIRPLGKGKGNTNERHDKRKSGKCASVIQLFSLPLHMKRTMGYEKVFDDGCSRHDGCHERLGTSPGGPER